MFPAAHSVVPVAPRSLMTLREIDKDAPRNAYLMERFEAQRTDVVRVASCVAHPNLLVLCTANGFLQVVDMAAGSFKLYLVFLDDGDNFVDLPPRCIAIDPAPSLAAASAHIGASEPAGGRELALVFAPSYAPTVCHGSTLTGVVHELTQMRSRPSAVSVDGDFAVAGDSAGEACAWRSGSYTLLWRQSLHRAAGVSDGSAVSVTAALQHRETCFFAMSNACIVVCAVRSGAVLTTLLDAGQGTGVAAILPTPPFADAVVEVSCGGQLTVWAPPLRAVGPTGAPTAVSLAAVPDAMAGHGWQVLNVVRTDMPIESASLHNGFLALGGSDGIVALFDATQLSVKKRSSSNGDAMLPKLVAFDLDLPIKHCAVGNDNHFSVVTGIGDVWRWPIHQVLPPVNSNNNSRTGRIEDRAEVDDEGDDHHAAGGDHGDNNDHGDDDDDEGDVPHHSTNIPTPESSQYGGAGGAASAARRILDPHEGTRRSSNIHNNGGGGGAASAARRILDPHEGTRRSNNNNNGGGGGASAAAAAASGRADSDIELDDAEEDDDNDPAVLEGRRVHEQFRRQQQQQAQAQQAGRHPTSPLPPLSGQQQQQRNHLPPPPAGGTARFDPNRNAGADDDEDEWFSESRATRQQPQTVIVMAGDEEDDEDLLNASDTAMPRRGGAPQPVPRDRDVSLSPTDTADEQQSPRGAVKNTRGGAGVGAPSGAASTINDTSLPSSVMWPAAHHLLGGASTMSAGEAAATAAAVFGGNNQLPPAVPVGGAAAAASSSARTPGGSSSATHTGSSPYTEGTVYSTGGSSSSGARQQQQQQQQRSGGAAAGAAAAAASSSSSGGGSSGNRGAASSSSSNSQRGSELRRNGANANANNNAAEDDDDDETATGSSPASVEQHPSSKTLSPQRGGRPSQQQQQQPATAAAQSGLSAMQAEAVTDRRRLGPQSATLSPPRELRHLAHGRRMDPVAAQAMLDRAVNIVHKNGGVASTHELATSVPHISKLLRQAARGEGGVRMSNEVDEEFDLQKYADEHRTLVAALEHQCPVRAAHYKPDDVAYYAIDLRRDAAASAAAVDGGGDDAEEKAFLEDRTRNNNNNSRQVGVHVRSPQRAGPVLARLDENKEAVGRLSPIARRDDLMPASARKHLVARRKDPVYEKQKKLAGPQLHDHLCADLLQPGMAGISTVFFSDKMSSSREPKPLVMPLPVPSTPLAF